MEQVIVGTAILAVPIADVVDLHSGRKSWRRRFRRRGSLAQVNSVELIGRTIRLHLLDVDLSLPNISDSLKIDWDVVETAVTWGTACRRGL